MGSLAWNRKNGNAHVKFVNNFCAFLQRQFNSNWVQHGDADALPVALYPAAKT